MLERKKQPWHSASSARPRACLAKPAQPPALAAMPLATALSTAAQLSSAVGRRQRASFGDAETSRTENTARGIGGADERLPTKHTIRRLCIVRRAFAAVRCTDNERLHL